MDLLEQARQEPRVLDAGRRFYAGADVDPPGAAGECRGDVARPDAAGDEHPAPRGERRDGGEFPGAAGAAVERVVAGVDQEAPNFRVGSYGLLGWSACCPERLESA